MRAMIMLASTFMFVNLDAGAWHLADVADTDKVHVRTTVIRISKSENHAVFLSPQEHEFYRDYRKRIIANGWNPSSSHVDLSICKSDDHRCNKFPEVASCLDNSATGDCSFKWWSGSLELVVHTNGQDTIVKDSYTQPFVQSQPIERKVDTSQAEEVLTKQNLFARPMRPHRPKSVMQQLASSRGSEPSQEEAQAQHPAMSSNPAAVAIGGKERGAYSTGQISVPDTTGLSAYDTPSISAGAKLGNGYNPPVAVQPENTAQQREARQDCGAGLETCLENRQLVEVYRKIKAKIEEECGRKNNEPCKSFRNAKFHFLLNRNGGVSKASVEESTGSQSYDALIMSAIMLASPFAAGTKAQNTGLFLRMPVINQSEKAPTFQQEEVASSERLQRNEQCSKEADMLHLHGEKRKDYRASCKLRIDAKNGGLQGEATQTLPPSQAGPSPKADFTYLCKANGKSYPLRIFDARKELTFMGKTYMTTEIEAGGNDCPRFGLQAKRQGQSIDFCTATQGVANFGMYDCQQKL